jgi:hypothetical protein
MSGEDKAREMAEKLKKDASIKAEGEKTAMAELKNELANIKEDPELMKMYQQNAQVGAKNLSGELPLLKIYSVGKSKAELADGRKLTDGWFFYKPLGIQFETITCHILTISRGFRAKGMVDQKTGKPGEPKFNQIMGGVIIDGSELRPFVMYFTGLKLSNLWEFGKEAGKFTKMKPVPIPMFALTVKMGTEQVENSYSESWIATFEILKSQTGFPIVVTDQTLFERLRESVDTVEDMIASVIEAKSTEDQVDQPVKIKTSESTPIAGEEDTSF